MIGPVASEPQRSASGRPLWQFCAGDWRVVFAGRDPGGTADARATDLLPAGADRVWLRQVHGARLVRATAGYCGEGDALLVLESQRIATIETADCVPVAIVAERGAALVHAGWRGIVAGVVGEAATAVLALGGPARAWIGPAIGPCCYEVNEPVASAVEAASDSSCRVAGPGELPHLDLRRAVTIQLAAFGIGEVAWVDACTRCSSLPLWSYRRDGTGCGRNWALLWRESPERSAAGRLSR